MILSQEEKVPFIIITNVLKIIFVFLLISVLVQNLNKAVQDILQHFGTVRQEAEKVYMRILRMMDLQEISNALREMQKYKWHLILNL